MSNSGDERIVITFTLSPDCFEIMIRDFGSGADPATFQGRDLDEIRPGGLGIHFIKSAVDKIEYDTPPGGGTLLKMIKFMPGQENDAKLNIQVNERKPGVFVVSLGGDLDMSSSPQVRNILLPIFRKKVSHIIVDLAEVPYIDSSGIATFVEALQLSRKGKVRFSLAGACRRVESIFDLAYLKNIFEMAPDANRLIEGEQGR